MVSTITDAPPAVWGKEELANMHAEYPDLVASADAVSKYNPTPGTGRTGFMNVPPNNYPFYSDTEKYVPVMQADGAFPSRLAPALQLATDLLLQTLVHERLTRTRTKIARHRSMTIRRPALRVDAHVQSDQ